MIYETAKIKSNEKIADKIYSLWIECDSAVEAMPGQFVNVYINNPAKLLPRPISICDVNGNSLRMVYRVTGEASGTQELSTYKTGDEIKITSPVGNGYPIDDIEKYESILLLGGGIGVPPMLYLAKKLSKKPTVILGYRDSNTFLKEEFEKAGAKVFIASDDGSAGTCGTVLDAMAEHDIKPDVICACGPKPMLSAVKKYAEEKGIAAYISLEERMACGIGACLGCVTGSTDIDDHSQVNNVRVCVDGPVFLANRVRL